MFPGRHRSKSIWAGISPGSRAGTAVSIGASAGTADWDFDPAAKYGQSALGRKNLPTTIRLLPIFSRFSLRRNTVRFSTIESSIRLEAFPDPRAREGETQPGEVAVYDFLVARTERLASEHPQTGKRAVVRFVFLKRIRTIGFGDRHMANSAVATGREFHLQYFFACLRLFAIPC